MSHNHVKHIKLGTPQNCPLCKMSNPSGLLLPNECIHCSGTGRIDFGILDEMAKQKANKEMTKNEKKLRKLLWLNHGCSLDTLYGDDGEMQCNKCLIDFKRDPVDQIEKLLFKARNWAAKNDGTQAIGRTLRDMGKM